LKVCPEIAEGLQNFEGGDRIGIEIDKFLKGGYCG